MIQKIEAGELLWTPSPSRIERACLTQFMRWLARTRHREFNDYASLWRWSIEDLEGFWSALWEYFDIRCSVPPQRAIGKKQMPGTEWFPGARLNYAENVLSKARPGAEALIYLSERQAPTSLSWDELTSRVRRLATSLRQLGIKKGDRVVACLPNTPDALVAMLASTSIGAIWSGCGPDFGTRGVLDRFAQLKPKLMFCVDGYQYGGKAYNRRTEMSQIATQLSLQHVVLVPYLEPHNTQPLVPGCILWNDLLAGPEITASEFQFEQVESNHPLWILFSSGTTGLPKPIMHGHAGIVIEQMKNVQFHMDVHPGQRMFFFTTTGWMMWNFLVSSLLSEAVPILYDGNPAWPDTDVLWKMVEQNRISFFGASPTYQQILAKQNIIPRERFDLSSLETLTLAGSPVTPECMQWFHANVKQDMWVQSGSGGTDICSGFVGGVVIQPVYAGEIQAPQLGVAVAAYDNAGCPVIDEVGEMVITQPLPSMPVGFWNDADNSRYSESYFAEFPGVWRQGDFFRINARGGCFVLGRSDATLNRHGIRIGTAEIYRSLMALPEIEDSLVVNLDLPGGTFFMPLFVKLKDSLQLDEALEQRIKHKLRTEYSPRHVPDRVLQVPEIPCTLTGKKLEVPVRRILSGLSPDQAANRAAMMNPAALDYFIEYARQQQDYLL